MKRSTEKQEIFHQKALKYCENLNLDINILSEKNKDQIKNIIKSTRTEQEINKLKNKQLHGQYLSLLHQNHIDKIESTKWLRDSKLKRTTEATICAIQEQAITTKYVQKHIHKTTNDDVCRACKQQKETIHHIISGCSTLAPTKYLQRHDNLCKYIHILLLEKYGIPTQNANKWYTYEPEPVTENEAVKILWNFPIQTDHQLKHNKPDIMVIEKTTRKAFIIDIAIPNDQNIAVKRGEKIRNYLDLSVEIKQMWNLSKTTIIPVIIGATGMIHNEFENLIKPLNINFNLREAQKIVLLGTVHITRAFLQLEA